MTKLNSEFGYARAQITVRYWSRSWAQYSLGTS